MVGIANTPDSLTALLLDRCVLNRNGCWVWQGTRDKNGYGIVRLRCKHYRIHRIAAWLYKRVPLRHPNIRVRHRNNKCDRACCNPDHLVKTTIEGLCRWAPKWLREKSAKSKRKCLVAS